MVNEPTRPFAFEHDVLQALGTPVAVVDAGGVVRWFNRAAEAMHGWDLSRDSGRRFSDLLPTLGDQGGRDIEAALRAGRHWSGTVVLTRSDGTTYPALLDCVPVHDGTGSFGAVVATSSDLTEIERMQRRFASGFEHSPHGRVFCDLDGVVTECNPVFAQIVGLDRAAVIGRRPDELTHVDDLDRRTPFEAMRDGSCPPVFATQKRYVRPDGTVRWVRVHTQLVTDHAERPEFFSGYVEDVTSLLESLAARESLERSYRDLFGQAVHSLGAALEVRDPYTAGHQHRVADLCSAIARQLGLTDDTVQGLAVCAEMHDIGKVATPAEILTKPGRLLDAEYEVVKLHAVTGHDILRGIEFPWPVARAVREHHERVDGSGYPDGLVGDAICLEARILTVADTVETIASHRPYQPARPVEVGLAIVSESAGRLYDPEVVSACVGVFGDGYSLPQHVAAWPVHTRRHA